MKKILFIILCLSTSMYAQEDIAGLVMPDTGFKSCCIYIPDSGLKLYNKPNGSLKGSIYLGKPDQHNEVYTAFIKANGIEKEIDHTTLDIVGYETMALKFVDIASGYAKLQNDYWISIKELKSKDMKLVSWMDYAVNKGIQWYANDPGLNLRTGPSTDFKKIVTLKGDLFGITPTGETKEKWSKVDIIQSNEHPCTGGDDRIINTYSGWVKLISEENTLNVWYYAKGC